MYAEEYRRFARLVHAERPRPLHPELYELGTPAPDSTGFLTFSNPALYATSSHEVFHEPCQGWPVGLRRERQS
jgi:hypothetical protein